MNTTQHMTRTRRIATAATALLASLLLWASTAHAQTSDQADQTMSATVVQGVTVTAAGGGMTWPQMVTKDGAVANNHSAAWTVSAGPGSNVSLSVTAPDALTDGAGHSLPLQYGDGTADATLYASLCDTNADGTADQQWVSHTVGIASCTIPNSGSGSVALGANSVSGAPSGASVYADPSSVATAGTYTGTATLTVTIN